MKASTVFMKLLCFYLRSFWALKVIIEIYLFGDISLERHDLVQFELHLPICLSADAVLYLIYLTRL